MLCRYQETGDVSTRPKTGRMRATTPQEDEKLVEVSRRNPKMTATEIAVSEGL